MGMHSYAQKLSFGCSQIKFGETNLLTVSASLEIKKLDLLLRLSNGFLREIADCTL